MEVKPHSTFVRTVTRGTNFTVQSHFMKQLKIDEIFSGYQSLQVSVSAMMMITEMVLEMSAL
jgi:hypothetical protein